MNACPLLPQAPGPPKGLHGARGWMAASSSPQGDRPQCCAFFRLFAFCTGTKWLSTQTDNSLIKPQVAFKFGGKTGVRPVCYCKPPYRVSLSSIADTRRAE